MIITNREGEVLFNLTDLEPWCHQVNGLPITCIRYAQNSVTITTITEEALADLRRTEAEAGQMRDQGASMEEIEAWLRRQQP